MKKIALIIVVFTTFQATAQRPSNLAQENMMSKMMSFFKDFTTEQIANLQTKRMSFYLDLSESQQKEVQVINLDITKIRKEKMKELGDLEKIDAKTKYEMMITRLDKQIEVKKKLGKILNAEQLKKWEEMVLKRHQFMNRQG